MLSQCSVPRRRLSVPRRTTDKPKVPTQATCPCVLPPCGVDRGAVKEEGELFKSGSTRFQDQSQQCG